MPQDIQFNRNEIGIQNVGTVQPVGIDAQTAALEQAGAALERTRQISVQNAATEFENKAREEIFNTYNQYQADPENLNKQLGKIKSKMSKGMGFGLGEIRGQMGAKFDLLAQGYQQKAIGNFQTMQNDKLQATALETLTATQRDASNLAPLLLSSDPVVNSQATQSYAVMMSSVEKTLGQVGVDGMPLYSEVDKVKVRQELADQTIFNAVEGAFNEAKTLGAKAELLRKFKSGELDIGLTMDLEGNAIKSNVRELMDYDKGSRLEEYMGKTIEAQQKKIISEGLATQKLRFSNPAKAARLAGYNTLAGKVQYQQGLGIPSSQVQVLESDEAKMAVQALSLAQSPDDIVKAAQAMEQAYGPYADNAINDMKRAKMPEEYATMMSLAKEDPALYNEELSILFNVAKSGGDKYLDEAYKVAFGVSPSASGEIEDSLNADLEEILPVLYTEGFSYQDTLSVSKRMNTLAKGYKVQNTSASNDDAIEFARKHFTDGYNVGEFKGNQFRVPKQFDAGQVEERLDAFYTETEFSVPAGEDLGEKVGASIKDIAKPFLNYDGSGIRFRTPKGTMLLDKEGNVAELKITDILATQTQAETAQESLAEKNKRFINRNKENLNQQLQGF